MHRRRVWWWARRWQRSRWVSCDAASTPGRRHRLANDADRRRQVRDHVITAELTSARRRTPSCSTIVGRARRLFQNASDSSSKSNGRQEQPAATWRHRITDSVTKNTDNGGRTPTNDDGDEGSRRAPSVVVYTAGRLHASVSARATSQTSSGLAARRGAGESVLSDEMAAPVGSVSSWQLCRARWPLVSTVLARIHPIFSMRR